jgi:hypothetical protein
VVKCSQIIIIILIRSHIIHKKERDYEREIKDETFFDKKIQAEINTHERGMVSNMLLLNK